MQKAPENKPAVHVVDRLMDAYGVSSLPALAAAMGEKLNTVKSWRQRDSVPIDALKKAAADAKCTLDWLALGIGPRQTKEPNRTHDGSQTEGASKGHSVT